MLGQGGLAHTNLAAVPGTGGTSVWSGSAAFTGTGSLSASTIQTTHDTATFNGTGLLSASTIQTAHAAATFSGAGLLSAYADLGGRDSATLNGTGSLSAHVFAAYAALAVFSGAGSLAVTTRQGHVASAVFNGTGSLSLPQLVHSAFNGKGHMCVSAKVYKGSIGPTTNTIVFGPGPTEMAIA